MASDIISSQEFISALTGAFAGALAAFLLSASFEWKKARDGQHAAIVKAQYALGLQRNDIANLLVQFLELHRSNPNRHLLVAQVLYPFSKLRVDLAELTFLVTAKYGNEITEVHFAQSSFENSLAALAEFNSTKLRFQEKAQFLRTDGGDIATFSINAPALIIVHELKRNLDNLFRVTDEAVARLDKAIIILAHIGETHLPERTFLAYTTDKPKTPPPPSVI